MAGEYILYLENSLHRSCKENEQLKNILNPKHPNFGELVIVAKKDLDTLQQRVDNLLESNNREVERRRQAEVITETNADVKVKDKFFTIETLIQRIKKIDSKEFSSMGSCGDGSFDTKQRNLEHKEKMAAISVLTHYFL